MQIDPITREEQYLNAVSEGEQVDIKPITRKEYFLAKAAGQDVNTPEPITREEMFLSKIASNGGTGGGGGSDGRGLKVIEAATIEELYNKVVALDNPVIFTITSDGRIEYDFDNGSGYIDFSGYVKCRVLDFGGGYGLTIEEFSPNAIGSAGIFCDGEIVEGEWFNIMENASYELTTIDMSGITKFTLYYF